jgi:DNA helicase-2/ATP-dependent DNA helicase PcrA
MEEERRLAFVAVTRAEKLLYLTRAESRNFDGTPQYPSRFILDIDRQLIQFTKEPREGLIKEARNYIELSRKYMPASVRDVVFPVGQRVRHAVFGTGTVTDVDRDRGAHVIQFDSMDTPRRISFRVKMERI